MAAHTVGFICTEVVHLYIQPIIYFQISFRISSSPTDRLSLLYTCEALIPQCELLNPLTAHHNGARSTVSHYASLGQKHKKRKVQIQAAGKPSQGCINIDELNISCLCSAAGECVGEEAQLRVPDQSVDRWKPPLQPRLIKA